MGATTTTSLQAARPRFDVLVLDDDADTRVTLVDLFERKGCRVRAVANVRDADAALRDRLPDVLLSDLHLGDDENGWALAERLRGDPCTRNIGRIAMTGRVDPKLEVVRGFDAYVRKPLDTSLLMTLVWQLARTSRGEVP